MSIDPRIPYVSGDPLGAAYRLSDLDRRLREAVSLIGQQAAGSIQGGAITADSITSVHIVANAITASEIAAGAIYAGALQAGSVTASSIAANAVTANAIAANSITASHLQANSVTATAIAAGAIYAGAIQAGAVTATHIATGTITATQIAAGTITASQIASDTITASQIAAGAITASELAASSITSTHITANAVTATAISANSVYAGAIQAGAVDATKITVSSLSSLTGNLGSITAGTITGGTLQTATSGSRVVMNSSGLTGYALNGTTKVFEINVGSGVASFTGVANIDAASVIPGGTVTVGTLPGDRIVTGSIQTLQLAAGSVVANTIAAGAVTAGKLTIAALDGSGNLSANTVGNTQLTTDSVTTSKILAATIQGGDIAGSTITGSNISAATITADKLSVTTLSAITADMGTLTAGTITGATVRTAASGTRVTLDSTGFKQFIGAASSPSIHFKTDGTDSNIFTGIVQARGIQLVPTDVYYEQGMVTWNRVVDNIVVGGIGNAVPPGTADSSETRLVSKSHLYDIAAAGAHVTVGRSSDDLVRNYVAIGIPELLGAPNYYRVILDGTGYSDWYQKTDTEDWHVVGGVGEPAYQNSWVFFGGTDEYAPQFRKDALGIVSLRGMTKNGTLGSSIFTLPVGYRPAATVRAAIMSNGVLGYGRVDPSGAVSYTGGSNAWGSLDTIRFAV